MEPIQKACFDLKIPAPSPVTPESFSYVARSCERELMELSHRLESIPFNQVAQVSASLMVDINECVEEALWLAGTKFLRDKDNTKHPQYSLVNQALTQSVNDLKKYILSWKHAPFVLLRYGEQYPQHKPLISRRCHW